MRYKVCMRCYAVVAVVGRGKTSCPSCNTLLRPDMVGRVKLCRHDGTPVPIDGHFCSTCGRQVSSWYNPQCGWLPLFALISIILTISLYRLHQHVYTSYQHATCTITAKSISSTTSKGRTTYYPGLTYTVLGNDGQWLASGNDGMGLESAGDWDEVRQELDPYRVGSSYACWYSEIASPTAALVRPDVTTSGVGEAMIWLPGTFILLCLLEVCIIRCFIFPWGLCKRTVQVVGKVVRHQERKTKNSSYTVSIIEYQTKTEPSLKCWIETRNTRPLGSGMNLCYDWLYPVQNHKVVEYYDKSLMTSAMLLGSVWMLLIACIGAGFFVWLAFRF